MNYQTATPEQQAKIREWINAMNQPCIKLASDLKRLFDSQLEEVERK